MANKKFLKEYIVRDGKRYEQSKTIIERFWLENGGCDLHRMRQCGLPCIYEDGYYYYNVEDFIAWHADKNYGNCPVGGEQDVS